MSTPLHAEDPSRPKRMPQAGGYAVRPRPDVGRAFSRQHLERGRQDP